MDEFGNFNQTKIDKKSDNSIAINPEAPDEAGSARPVDSRIFSQNPVVPKTAKTSLINLSDFFGKLTRGIIYLAVFLMPIFIIPYNSEYWETPKQHLLVFLSAAGLILWIIKSVFIDKEIKIRFTALDLAVFLFVAVSAVSVLMGIDPIMSILGYYGSVSGSMLEISSLGVLYFLIVNSSIDGYKLAKAFAASSLFASFASLLWAAGVFPKILPQSIIGEFPIFSLKLINTMGLSNGILIWQLAAVAAFIAGAIFAERSAIDKKNIASGPKGKMKPKKYTAGFFLPFIVIFIIFLSSPQYKNPVSEASVLDDKTSWKIVQNEVNSQNIKNLLIGSGPATFSYNFSLYKSAEFSRSANWNLRYGKSGSDIAEKIITVGAIGTALYILILMAFFSAVFRFKKIYPEFAGAVLLFSAVLVLNQIFNPQSVFLDFSFWLMLSAGSAVFVPQRKKIFKIFDFSPAFRSVLAGGAVLFILVLGFGVFKIGQFYIADIVFSDSLKKEKEGNFDSVEKGIAQAAARNPYRFDYHAILAKLYLKEINKNIKELKSAQNTEKNSDIANLIDKAIKEAGKAAEIAPRSAVVYEISGSVYANLNGLVDGAGQWAKKSYSRALEFEPANPALLTELGKIIFTEADKASGQDAKIDEAIIEFQKALSLKPDYYEAGLRLSLALEKKGDMAQAISILEEIENKEGDDLMLNNSEAAFHLGRLYYNSGRTDDAILQFQKVIDYYPNYSNALYSLGLAYEKIGKKSEAKAEFKKVLELNPENKEIKKKIKELESASANNSANEEISSGSANEELP